MSVALREHLKDLAEERKLGDPTVWRPHDPAWMEDRRDEWRTVLVRLAGCRIIHRSYWRYLKDYFFFGTPLNPSSGYGLEELYVEICTWWLHPNGEGLGRFVHNGSSQHYMVGKFKQLYYELGTRIRQSGDSDYGVMGGREQQIMLAMNPGLDFRETFNFGHGNKMQACLEPHWVLTWCLGHTEREIRSYTQKPLDERQNDSAYIAFRPCLLFWDHLSYAMGIDERLIYMSSPVLNEKTCELDMKNSINYAQLEKNEDRVDEMVEEVLTSVLTFFDRPLVDDSRQRPKTVAYVEMLLDRYERRDFSDPLLKRWDEAKREIPRSGNPG